jgi:hypothetical protein
VIWRDEIERGSRSKGEEGRCDANWGLRLKAQGLVQLTSITLRKEAWVLVGGLELSIVIDCLVRRKPLFLL